MEDVMCKYDGTLRNSAGNVLQFLYGEDGMDGVHIDSQKLPTISMTDEHIRQKMHFDPDKAEWSSIVTHPKTLVACREEDARQLFEKEYMSLCEDAATLRAIRARGEP